MKNPLNVVCWLGSIDWLMIHANMLIYIAKSRSEVIYDLIWDYNYGIEAELIAFNIPLPYRIAFALDIIVVLGTLVLYGKGAGLRCALILIHTQLFRFFLFGTCYHSLTTINQTLIGAVVVCILILPKLWKYIIACERIKTHV